MQAEMELNNGQICAIGAAIGIACLAGFHANMPDHKVVAKKLIELEVAIGSVARLAGEELTEEFLVAGTHAWGAAMSKMDEVLNKNNPRPKVGRDSTETSKGSIRSIS